MAKGGYVTTHALDTSLGRPASGLKVEVYRLDGESRTHIASMATNADGRTDQPVIGGEDIAEAVYELVFHAGAYLDKTLGASDGVRFLDTIPIRFGVSDASQHYHVPLLLSPFGYSTYRGS
ncbi:MAG: hydroxyisourate hydrolase [Hyphomicrobiales bacterium]|nr:hydroxyisourate hydrolase [Hyphomicrobiales bacterium]